MIKLLVTGANGQLGSDLKDLANNLSDIKFTFIDLDELDISNSDETNNYFASNTFNYVVNCAAYTAVDNAEEDKENAFKVNALAVKNLISGIQAFQTKLVHISTDYVFRGDHNSPYPENFPTDPQSNYGKSKLAGEKEALMYSNSMIIRTSWLYSSYGHNFVKSILKKGRENEELKVVNDQLGSPTYSGHLAKAILQIINSDIKKEISFTPGIFHFTNMGVCSWYEFALKIKEYANLPCRIQAVPTKHYPLPAKRPAYSVLSKEKIISTYKLNIPGWEEGLKDCLKRLNL